jgi:hypothetical protein
MNECRADDVADSLNNLTGSCRLCSCLMSNAWLIDLLPLAVTVVDYVTE